MNARAIVVIVAIRSDCHARFGHLYQHKAVTVIIRFQQQQQRGTIMSNGTGNDLRAINEIDNLGMDGQFPHQRKKRPAEERPHNRPEERQGWQAAAPLTPSFSVGPRDPLAARQRNLLPLLQRHSETRTTTRKEMRKRQWRQQRVKS